MFPIPDSRKYLSYLFILPFCLLIITSCKKEKLPSVIPAQTIKNISYGSDALQKMDVYLPAGRSVLTTKVIVLIHGGAWSSGDKADFDAYVDTLKRRIPDYAILNINYRLGTGTSNFFPSQENDVKAALEFIVNKSAEYYVSQKIVLLGASAGGHLALLQGYKYASLVQVKAIVDFFGPTDMTDLYNNPASPAIPSSSIALIVGTTPTINPTLYQQSSPITFVSTTSPPTIILQGGLDQLVSPSQSVALRNKLQTMGVVNQYVYYPLENHGWTGSNLTDSFNKIEAFLAAYVN